MARYILGTIDVVRGKIRTKKEGVPVDATNDRVDFYFYTPGTAWSDPATITHVGAWEPYLGNGYAVAYCRIGTGGVTLPLGTFNVAVKLADSPNTPVFRIGSIRVVAG